VNAKAFLTKKALSKKRSSLFLKATRPPKQGVSWHFTKEQCGIVNPVLYRITSNVTVEAFINSGNQFPSLLRFKRKDPGKKRKKQ